MLIETVNKLNLLVGCAPPFFSFFSHTHTHTHTHIYIVTSKPIFIFRLLYALVN